MFGQRVDKAISANSAKERSFLQPIRLSHYHLALLIEFAPVVPQPTEWQHIGNQIDAAMIFARSDFVGMACFQHR